MYGWVLFMKRIAVIGCGPSGLFTTFFLNQKSVEPLEISLFEADSRLGGKVETKQFDSAPVLYEAGAAELYQYGKDPLWLLVTQVLQLPVIRMKGETVVLQD